MYSKTVALVLGILSFIPPFSGLLRFYLKRYPSGTVFTLTAGLCFIGNILDIVQIPQLVKEANMKLKRRELNLLDFADGDDKVISQAAIGYRKKEESMERYILLAAKRNKGYTTPAEVALESEKTIEAAKEALDYLVSKGFAEMKIAKNGTIVYHFPEILDEVREEHFEDLT